jgi:hypothetical protein
MREFINVYTIGGAAGFVKCRAVLPLLLYPDRENRYNKGSLSAEVAELADA